VRHFNSSLLEATKRLQPHDLKINNTVYKASGKNGTVAGQKAGPKSAKASMEEPGMPTGGDNDLEAMWGEVLDSASEIQGGRQLDAILRQSTVLMERSSIMAKKGAQKAFEEQQDQKFLHMQQEDQADEALRRTGASAATNVAQHSEYGKSILIKKDRRGTVLNSSKMRVRERFGPSVLAKKPKSAMKEEQELEIIQLFAEHVIENCRALIRMLYRCLLYFFSPCVPISELEMLQEAFLGHLTHLVIRGELAREVYRLCRLSTMKEEEQLALRSLQNKSRALLSVGVDALFCLNNHTEYLRNEVEGLSEHHIKEYFDRPFRQAVDYVKVLDRREKWSPQEKMDHVEKLSRSIIAEIDDYYAKTEEEKAKPIEKQNRYIRFKKREEAYERATGKKLKIDYEKMFSHVPAVRPDKLVLDADQMLMITVYVLLQSRLHFVKLYSHIRMVYEFQTESQKNSQKGYVISCLEVCLESIYDEEPPEEENPVSINQSIVEPPPMIEKSRKATIVDEKYVDRQSMAGKSEAE
jgi:hypothetical protein